MYIYSTSSHGIFYGKNICRILFPSSPHLPKEIMRVIRILRAIKVVRLVGAVRFTQDLQFRGQERGWRTEIIGKTMGKGG